MADKDIPITCQGAEYVPIEEFNNLQGMLKELDEDAYERLKHSILKYGFRFPVFYANIKGKKYIIDAHQRLNAVKRLISEGYTIGDIPCNRIDAKDRKEAKEVLLALNAKYGTMTTGGLDEFLKSDNLQLPEIEKFFLPSEFTIEEFHKVYLPDEMEMPDIEMPGSVRSSDDSSDEDYNPSKDEEFNDEDQEDEAVIEVVNPVIKKGDVIQLGKHRLMCGSSQDREAVTLLMGDEKADMMFTDPPYNYVGKNKLLTGTTTNAMKVLKDEKWDEEFVASLFLDIAKDFLKPDTTMYICTSHHLAGEIWAWLAGWADYHGYCTYSKINPMPSMMKRHWTWDSEIVCYGTKGKHTFNFPDEGHAPSTWRLNKNSKNNLHPTQKPINVPAHAILHSSKPEDIIVDFFGGSGSTLMACEIHNRKCRIMEIAPNYAQVIVERYVTTTSNSKITINGKKVDWYEYKTKNEK